MAEYANIIVDIFNEKLDKTFQYRIPEAMKEKLTLGMQVYVPFGRRNIKGYVVELTDEPEFEVAKIKEIIGIVTDSVPIESQLIALAGWMKKNYGATMNHALKTVIPIKKKSNAVEHKSVRLKLTEIEAKSELAEFERKHQKARVRLLSALIENPQMDQSMITQKLNVSGAVIRALETMGIVEVVSERSYRNPVSHLDSKGYHLTLNGEQQSVVDVIERNLDQKIAKTYLIKGVTGSGKTSLIQLLCRLYDATGGTIYLDNVDIRKLSLRQLRSCISTVMQDVFLFSDTIQENVMLGQKGNLNISDVRLASRDAQASEFIDRLSEQYDTVIGERGVGLSGGQKQRISIARALAKHTPVLVLDDSTSALDMETEYAIQQTLTRLPHTTKLIIAHRISAVRHADEIIVLENGHIAERGTHEELLALHGLYYQTWQAQFGMMPDQKEVTDYGC